MRAPSRKTAPPSGRSSLVMRLNTVVLPEPLGPISPTTVAGATANEQSLTARRPPNDFVSPATASRGGSAAWGLMRPRGASLLLPRVRRRPDVLAVGLGGHLRRIDRHLLAA